MAATTTEEKTDVDDLAAALENKPGAGLKTVVFMGSARNKAAHWGGPTRLGTRVLKFVTSQLKERGHEVTVMDPLEIPSLSGTIQVPAFYYKPNEKPAELQKWEAVVKAADCFVIVSCEYNHSIPPSLTTIMSHFGGSLYKCKCSAIVCYSNGQYGGMRAAMQMRALTGELGCLSTSNILGVPKAESE